jgi:hypothetical protein
MKETKKRKTTTGEDAYTRAEDINKVLLFDLTALVGMTPENLRISNTFHLLGRTIMSSTKVINERRKQD